MTGKMSKGQGANARVNPPVVVQVAGEFACFTRPELKVERVSYPVMTPSGAKGLLEAIFWKPEFRYHVRTIEVLRPISWFRVKRNEVKGVVSLRNAADGATVDIEANRDPRSTLGLRDVAYRIHADIEVLDDSTKNEAAYRDQFRRRVAKGACFSQPFWERGNSRVRSANRMTRRRSTKRSTSV
jgi:CRISPR-associated protein Cas5d